VTLLFGWSAFGQSVPMRVVPAPPTAGLERNLPPSIRDALPPAAQFTMPPLNTRSLPTTNSRRQPLIGQHRPLPAQAQTAGGWSHSSAGRALWRLQITDPQAIAVRIHFRNFDVGDGQVWVHNGRTADSQVLGPFTHRGTFGNGDFWTSFIFGDTLVVEYESSGAATPSAPPFQIEGVTHLWEFMGKKSVLAPKDVDTSCELDATCYVSDQPVADALPTVVMLVVPVGPDLIAECTGTMMNDRNSTLTPYLLTAGHCITSDSDAQAVSVYWNYQTNGCNGATPNWQTLPSVTGGTLLSQNLEPGGLDYALVQLSSAPNASWALAGWDPIDDVNQNDSLYSISHPRLLPKRFAYLSMNLPLFDSDVYTTTQGRIDHGSSGSALFSPGAIVHATVSTANNDDSVSACTVADQSTTWTKFSSVYPRVTYWLEDQVTETATSPAEMQSPAPGSRLTDSTITFTWTQSATALEYILYVGTTGGAQNLLAQNTGLATSFTVNNLPTDGTRLYFRLWSHLPDNWYYNDYIYTAAGGTTTLAQMFSPAPATILTGLSATFKWTKSATALEYFFYLGTTVGAQNLMAQNTGLATSFTVNNLPTDGSVLYIRLWSHLPDNWYYNDYVYGAAGATTTLAQIFLPAPGSTLTGPSTTFAWTKSATALEYILYIGTTAGAQNLLAQNTGLATSFTVSKLPTDGTRLYFRLWSHLPDNWYYNDYVYSGGTTTLAQMILPAPGSTLSGPITTFTWTKSTTASEYYVYIGTTVGSQNLFGLNTGPATSVTAALPANGVTLYLRLWSHLPDNWYYNDYVYTAAGP
jgi:hypothetical protein